MRSGSAVKGNEEKEGCNWTRYNCNRGGNSIKCSRHRKGDRISQHHVTRGDLRKSIFTALPKKSGRPPYIKCESHRTSRLMSQVTKLILMVLLVRANFKRKIRERIAEEQHRLYLYSLFNRTAYLLIYITSDTS